MTKLKLVFKKIEIVIIFYLRMFFDEVEANNVEGLLNRPSKPLWLEIRIKEERMILNEENSIIQFE